MQNRGEPIGPGATLTVAVRAEYLGLGPPDAREGLAATVTQKSFAGGQLRITAVLEGGEEIVASRHGIDSPLKAGEQVRVNWAQAAQAVIVDREDGYSSDNGSIL